MFKIAIIGSGPSGLSAAVHAAELGVPHVLLESEQHPRHTIYKYQKGKYVMAEPNVLPLRSPMSFKAGRREEILGTWDQELAKYSVNLVESFGIKSPNNEPAAVPQLSGTYESNVPGLYIVGLSRIRSNVAMESQVQSGTVTSYLMQQGIGEATDVLMIDESLCIRCNNCKKAFADVHEGTSRLNREAGPTCAQIHVPTSCRHCEHPHCMKDCPPDAINRAPKGRCTSGIRVSAVATASEIAHMVSFRWRRLIPTGNVRGSGSGCSVRRATSPASKPRLTTNPWSEGRQVRHVQGPAARSGVRQRLPDRCGAPRLARALPRLHQRRQRVAPLVTLNPRARRDPRESPRHA